MSSKLINRIIFLLAIIGMCVAAYVAYTWLTKSPIVCISGGCEIVRKNELAWPFGIPFPLFGLVGYAFIAFMSFLKTVREKSEKTINKIIFGFTCFGVGLVSYFTFLETYIIKGYCMWCVISTIIMLILFFLALKQLKHQSK